MSVCLSLCSVRNTSWLHGHLENIEPSGELAPLLAIFFFVAVISHGLTLYKDVPSYKPEGSHSRFQMWKECSLSSNPGELSPPRILSQLHDLAPTACCFWYQALENPVSYWAADRDSEVGRELPQGPQLSQRSDQVCGWTPSYNPSWPPFRRAQQWNLWTPGLPFHLHAFLDALSPATVPHAQCSKRRPRAWRMAVVSDEGRWQLNIYKKFCTVLLPWLCR